MFDGYTVKKYRHRRSIKSVRHKSRLNHNKRTVNVLFIPGMTKINYQPRIIIRELLMSCSFQA